MLLKWIADRWTDRMVRETDFTKPITDNDLARFEDPKNGIIILQENCVQVKRSESVDSMLWADVRAIYAYKRDLFSTDLICLVLGARNDAPILEANEEMQGFIKLWRELEQRFSGFKENYTEWLLHSPAFDSSSTCVWKKEESRSEGI